MMPHFKCMQLAYFFEENISESARFTLSETSSRHIIQVLRMQEGDLVNITNGQGVLLTCKITDANKKACEVTPAGQPVTTQPKQKISIAISPIKNNSRFEWFVEKSTEIGINEVIPLICTRTEKTHLKKDRLQQISVSAMLQSRQTWMPQIREPVHFTDLISSEISGLKLIAHCLDYEKRNVSFLAKNDQPKLILIGPEGDFTEKEIAAALDNNFKPVSLGETRLRTETAGIAAAVLLRNYLEE